MKKLAISGLACLAVVLLAVVFGQLNPSARRAAAQDGPDDVLVSYGVYLDVPGFSGFFTEVSGLGSENDVIEHKVVTKAGTQVVRKLPGRLKWNDITLKRGMTSNLDLWKWRKMVEDGNIADARKSGSLILVDPEGEPMAQWEFKNAWPSKITGPSFSSGSERFPTEEITLVHEFLERVK